jgi:hypothetical protein
MANRFLSQFVLSPNKAHTIIAGQVALSAAAAVSSNTFASYAESVVKTATGVYTITLKDKWVGLLAAEVSLQGGQDGTSAKVGANDVSSAKTVIVRTVDAAGANVDVTAVASIHVVLHLKNSTAK